MAMSQRRVRLGRHPFPRVTRKTVVGVTVLLAPAGALVWVTWRVILIPPLQTRPIRFWDEVVPAVGVATGVLLFAAFFGFLAYLVLESARKAWWLAGTRLGHRRALRTAWVDLSTADVGTRGPVEQSLVARAASGATVTLPVRRYGEPLLPADHLIAVAEAITRDRPRSGPHDPAYLVAERLRRLAVEPATVVHRADTAAATPDGHRGRPVLLLAVAVLFLGLSISYGRIAVQEAQVRLDYGAGRECQSSTDTGGCWTRSTATVVDVSLCTLSRRVCQVGTRYDLRLVDGRTAEVELYHAMEGGPTEGGTMEVRVFRDRVVSVHDGERWWDTLAHPRVALASSLSLAGALTGVCLGALIGAASAAWARIDQKRRPGRDRSRPRRRWGWIGGVVVVAPLPALLASHLYSGPPVWTLVLLTAATAAIGVVVHFRQRVVVHFRRAGKAGPAPTPAEAPSPADEQPGADTSPLRYALTVLLLAGLCVGGPVTLGILDGHVVDSVVYGVLFGGLTIGMMARELQRRLRQRASARATGGGTTGGAEPDRVSADVAGAGDDELGGGQLR